MCISNIELAYLYFSNNKVVRVNNAFIKLTGYDENQFLGKSSTEVFKILRSNITGELEINEGNGLDCFIFTKSLAVKSVTISNEYKLNGEAKYCLTEKEEFDLNNNNYINEIYKSDLIGLAMYSYPEMILLKANEKYLYNLHKTFNIEKNCIGIKKEYIMRNYNKGDIEGFWKKIIQSGEIYHNRKMKVIDTYGKHSYWDITVVPIRAHGDIKYLAETIIDVPEESVNIKSSEENLINYEKELSMIFNNIQLPVICVSYPDFFIKKINNEGLRLLRSLKKSNLLNMGDSFENKIKFSNEDNIECINQMIKTKTVVNLKKFTIKLDDKVKYYKISYQPILDMNSEVSEFFMIAIDITNEEEEMNELRKSIETRENSFSFIVHEFRTPLTTLSATIQLIECVYKSEISDKLEKYIKMMNRNVNQQLRLVNNLLDITRAETGYLKVHSENRDIVSMTKEIIKSINTFAKSKNISVKFNCKLKQKVIAIDDEKYERILLNLLSNAIKYTPEHKNIEVDIVIKNNNFVDIIVKDEGVGIAKEKQSIIFDRFGQSESVLTRKSEGTGIGLYLVKLLVKALGGNITLTSEENMGSTFIISLPDIKIEFKKEKNLQEFTNNRLVQNMKVEFSTIYLE